MVWALKAYLKDIIATVAAPNIILKPPVFIFCSILHSEKFSHSFFYIINDQHVNCTRRNSILKNRAHQHLGLPLFLQGFCLHLALDACAGLLHLYSNLSQGSGQKSWQQKHYQPIFIFFELCPPRLDLFLKNVR